MDINEQIEGGLAYVVYVIISDGGRRYIGHTSDLERRLAEHNAGLCKSTKVDFGWQIAYQEVTSNRGEAMKRERWLKTGVGREFLERKMSGAPENSRRDDLGST